MGLLDQLFGQPGSAESASMYPLAAGLLRGDLASGLLGAGAILSPEARMKRQMAELQLQEAQQGIADKQRARDFLQNLSGPQMMASQQALAGGGGPTAANAARMPAVNPMSQMLFEGARAGVVPFEHYINSMAPKAPIKLGAEESLLDPNTYKPLVSGQAKLPAQVQEYEYARKQGYPGTYQQFVLEQKKAGANSVSLAVNTDKSYFGNIAEKLAGADASLIDSARTAPERIQNAQRVKTLLSQNPITGTGAEARLSLNRALTTAGLIDGKNVADTETLASMLASQTLDAIRTSGLGSGQGFTDKDRQFLERARSGNIEMNAETLRRLADMNERSARISIQRGNKVIGNLRSTPQSGQMGQFLEQIPEPPMWNGPSVVRQPGQPASTPSGVRFLGFE